MIRYVLVVSILVLCSGINALAEETSSNLAGSLTQCEARLELTNTLLADFAMDRQRAQVELAETKVALRRAQQELQTIKAKDAKSNDAKKPK